MSEPEYERAIEAFRSLGDEAPGRPPQTLASRAPLSPHGRAPTEQKELASEALELDRQHGNRRDEAIALNILAMGGLRRGGSRRPELPPRARVRVRRGKRRAWRSGSGVGLRFLEAEEWQGARSRSRRPRSPTTSKGSQLVLRPGPCERPDDRAGRRRRDRRAAKGR